MKIVIASDHGGYELKQFLIDTFKKEGYDFVDYGTDSADSVDYPDYAIKVGEAVAAGEFDRGILICGTGIGVAITANKLNGIRAALAHDYYSAERAQLSNNAQILTMGAQIIGIEVAKKNVEAYLNVSWEGGSQRKVDKIDEIEAHENT